MEQQRSPVLAAALSMIVPGLGQAYNRQRYRGIAILLSALTVLGIVAWYRHPIWYVSPVAIWLWNAWDAAGLASNRPRSMLLPVLFGMVATYGIGIQVLNIDLRTADINRAISSIIRPMSRPDFFQRRSDVNEMWVEIQVPCIGDIPSGVNQIDSKTASITPCVPVGELVTTTVSGLWPNVDTNIWWEDPNGQDKMINPGENAMLVIPTDAGGKLTTSFRVPTTALIAVPDPTITDPHRVYFRQYHYLRGIELSFIGKEVIKGAYVTVGMGLMATVLAIFFAIPLSFLAARNLMSGNPIIYIFYVIIRTLLNILRSIESLIIAIVFVRIVGLGPFAGVLAMAIHSVAALAKLYSEVIEGIDQGPIEAIRATGANWLQTVVYAVIPQIVPAFTAFTIYRWDINVRSATIVGLVGGGGLGFLLIELIRINDMRGVSAVFIAIAIIVIGMDTLSAKIRERLI